MDWTRIVNDLESAGLRQVDIARAIGAAQSTVSDLSTGRHGGRLSFEIGANLLDLWRKRCAKGRKQASPPTAEAA